MTRALFPQQHRDSMFTCETLPRKKDRDFPPAAVAALYKCGGMPHLLYAVRCVDFIKFGITQKMSSRMSGMRTDNPFPLEILGALWATDRVESFLHEYLKEEAHQGEWFHRTPRTKAISLFIASDDLDGLLAFIEFPLKPVNATIRELFA